MYVHNKIEITSVAICTYIGIKGEKIYLNKENEMILEFMCRREGGSFVLLIVVSKIFYSKINNF